MKREQFIFYSKRIDRDLWYAPASNALCALIWNKGVLYAGSFDLIEMTLKHHIVFCCVAYLWYIYVSQQSKTTFIIFIFTHLCILYTCFAHFSHQKFFVSFSRFFWACHKLFQNWNFIFIFSLLFIYSPVHTLFLLLNLSIHFILFDVNHWEITRFFI